MTVLLKFRVVSISTQPPNFQVCDLTKLCGLDRNVNDRRPAAGFMLEFS